VGRQALDRPRRRLLRMLEGEIHRPDQAAVVRPDGIDGDGVRAVGVPERPREVAAAPGHIQDGGGAPARRGRRRSVGPKEEFSEGEHSESLFTLCGIGGGGGGPPPNSDDGGALAALVPPSSITAQYCCVGRSRAPSPPSSSSRRINDSDEDDTPRMCLAAKDRTVASAFPFPLVPAPRTPEACRDREVVRRQELIY
jgi:hypothetical protein